MSEPRYHSILFVDAANATSSQMAEGLARDIFGGAVRVCSAGRSPSQLHPEAINAMAELGLSLAGHVAKTMPLATSADVDLLITLGDRGPVPASRYGTPHMHWDIPEPARGEAELSAVQLQDRFRGARDAIGQRLEVLAALRELPPGPTPSEFHASIRVPNLAAGARFYSWLLGVAPRTWTHRYVTFVSDALRTNFVLVVDDGKVLNHDTLYHLGIDVGTQAAVIETHHLARAAGWHIHKPARTTWRGTPLHELWLKDPGGNLIEVYARLTADQLAQMPQDKEPVVLASDV